jgi:hypothetical protein
VKKYLPLGIRDLSWWMIAGLFLIFVGFGLVYWMAFTEMFKP